MARFLGGNFDKKELDLERSGITDSMAQVESFLDGKTWHGYHGQTNYFMKWTEMDVFFSPAR